MCAVRISLLEKESSTGSTLLSAWGSTNNQWNTNSTTTFSRRCNYHYEELTQS